MKKDKVLKEEGKRIKALLLNPSLRKTPEFWETLVKLVFLYLPALVLTFFFSFRNAELLEVMPMKVVRLACETRGLATKGKRFDLVRTPR